jgi:hypothetical protein
MKVGADESQVNAFAHSLEVFTSLATELETEQALALTHGDLEVKVFTQGRELLRTLVQDQLNLRAIRESRLSSVVGSDRIARTRTEPGRTRSLGTIFGDVAVERIAYKSPEVTNLHPADAVLNLPEEKHSHGLRKLAALESVRGSFDGATDAIERSTGVKIAKAQVEELAARAAQDIDDFYEANKPGPSPDSDVLVMSCDGKGIVMRPDSLREPTAKKANDHKLNTRLSPGEKTNRKRMAEVGAVYDITPAQSRVPTDVIKAPDDSTPRKSGPQARGKWLTASVESTTEEVIASVFDEADRRDGEHGRQWVALVDGNAHQISCIEAQAKTRHVSVFILLDFVHVLEYLWTAAWCFFPKGDPKAEQWVAKHARSILNGQSGLVAGAINRKATYAKLEPGAVNRKGADDCAKYLLNKAQYLKYDKALESGWPIGTGIIEGACRYLVKDRMDITGARWSVKGAEAILKLRALVSNDDFDRYYPYHLEQEQLRVHYSRYRDIPESIAA